MSAKQKVYLVLFTAVVLAAGWWATFHFGAPKARLACLREMGLDPMRPSILNFSGDHNGQSKIPWFYCNATARAPFIVRVDYGFVKDRLTGRDARAYYFWFCGWLVLINDKTLSSI